MYFVTLLVELQLTAIDRGCVSKHMATTSSERNTAVMSIVVRFCANASIKNRQSRKLIMWFYVFTRARP
jgi:hypothetical protein